MRRLLLVVVALIVYGSLYPWHFDFSPRVNPLDFLLHSWSFQWDRYLLRDVAVNVALYVPLGAAAALALARKHGRGVSAALAILLGMALSASVEMLQIYVPGRQCSLLDVATNTIGTAAGAWLALIAWPSCVWEPCDPPARAPRRRGGLPAGLLGGLSALSLLPYPQPDPFAERPGASLPRLHGLAGGDLGLRRRMGGRRPGDEGPVGRMRLPWLVLAMACLPLRILIAGRVLALDEVLGAALALLLWPAIDRASAGVAGRS